MAQEYACIECGRRSDEPLEVQECRKCGRPFCWACRPDHQAKCQPADGEGHSAAERFAQLERFFLRKLAESGSARESLYREKRADAYGNFSEEELLRQYADALQLPLPHLLLGIEAGFAYAQEHGAVVTSFRYVIPHVIRRIRKGTPL